MSGLFAIAKLKDPFGNPRTLKVSISDDGELFYRMHNPKTRKGFAISNLQLRIPLPDLRENTAKETVTAIHRSLLSGVYLVEELKMAVDQDQPESKKDFLQFIYDRLAYVHDENKNTDYMRKLKAIVEDEK